MRALMTKKGGVEGSPWVVIWGLNRAVMVSGNRGTAAVSALIFLPYANIAFCSQQSAAKGPLWTCLGARSERIRQVFGEESRSSNKQFLFRRITWRLQANAGRRAERARPPSSRSHHPGCDLRTRGTEGVLARSGPI
jgi:hypothetical protein